MRIAVLTNLADRFHIGGRTRDVEARAGRRQRLFQKRDDIFLDNPPGRLAVSLGLAVAGHDIDLARKKLAQLARAHEGNEQDTAPAMLAPGEAQNARLAQRIAAIACQHMHHVMHVAQPVAIPFDRVVEPGALMLVRFLDQTLRGQPLASMKSR